MAGGANPAATQAAANPYSQASAAQKGALAGTAAGMAYQPSQIQATSYNAAQMGGPATAASGMANYTNPYENQVVQQSLADVGRQAQMGFNQLGAQAQAAGAFGGSRHGIAQAELGRGYTQQMANTAAQMRQQGFNTALGASQFDVGQQQQAAMQNMAAQNAALQFGAQAGMTAQQLNQQAGLQGAQQSLGAAAQLGNLGQQSFGYGQAIQQQQMQQGAQQQAAMQALIDAAKGQYAGYTGAPQQGLQTFLGALAGMPQMGSTQTSSNPGLFNYLQTAAMAAGGMR